MSNFRAIAGVSASLRALLEDRMERTLAQGSPPVTVPVTVAPPDVTPATASGRRVNLYLYLLTENGALKNQDLPGRDTGGGYGHPPLALDLHYLLTAYPENEQSDTADIEAQTLLGDAMRVLHDVPIITPTLPRLSAPGQFILSADLRDAFERVKLTLHPASLDDFTKIWTAMPEANFRRSVMYDVSVVQIESAIPRRASIPVLTRRLHLTTASPVIEAVYRTPAPGETVGDLRVPVLGPLTIAGDAFLADQTTVRIGAAPPVTVRPSADPAVHMSDTEIQLPVPDDPALQPGPAMIQVECRRSGERVEGGVDRGTSASETQTLRSNQMPVLIVPYVTSVEPVTTTLAAVTGAGVVVRVQGRRLFRTDHPSTVLVGSAEFTPLDPANPATPPGTARSPVDVSVRLHGLAAGRYVLRARVDGVDSIGMHAFEVTP